MIYREKLKVEDWFFENDIEKKIEQAQFEKMKREQDWELMEVLRRADEDRRKLMLEKISELKDEEVKDDDSLDLLADYNELWDIYE